MLQIAISITLIYESSSTKLGITQAILL